MTFQSPITSTAGAAPLLPREPAPHRCGKCFNPYTGGRADCVNAPKPPRTEATSYFTDEYMAALMIEWGAE